jgi:short-subunit dehydrogenase
MIIVTGASEGIGYESAKALLARSSDDVLITGRNEGRLQAARRGVDSSGQLRLRTLVSDQASRDDVDALIARMEDQSVSLRAIVLSVGVNPRFIDGPRKLHAVAPSVVESTVRTNCTHTMLLTAAALRHFRTQRCGTLIWIGSQSIHHGSPGAATYCATKAFLSGLARSLHSEYAAWGIRVQLIHPGLVYTPRTSGMIRRLDGRLPTRVSRASDIGRMIADRVLSMAPLDAEVDA